MPRYADRETVDVDATGPADGAIALSVCCVRSSDGQALALVLTDEIVRWRTGLDDLRGRLAHRFGRSEPRRQTLSYSVGLLSPLAAKNGWTLAEAAGDATPDRMQRLLGSTRHAEQKLMSLLRQ
ncbi:hypothetical protein GA0074694_3630 [Micromonospora inyonensis]|uniref:Uncharacterized protein n=1 Tax=Micromonospora inyonensis TaxID=47866 RepID=A0A1C6S1N2_9ACTN|nr:hypothetical protein GA0074694_3630 [Micromonospora inyonensis]